MNNDHLSSVVLAVFLTICDLVTAFFSFLGGWNMLARSGAAGYLTISFGVVLLYLSSGLWTGQRWKLYSRLAMYGVPFCALCVSAAFLMVVRAPGSGDLTVFAVLVVSLVIIVASCAHLRVGSRGRASSDSMMASAP
jgi:hypothetical protein